MIELNGSILASLSSAVTEDDARDMIQGVAHTLGTDQVFAPILRSGFLDLKVAKAILRAIYQSPQGRDMARQIVLRQVAYDEAFRAQVKLSVIEGCRLLAFPGERYSPQVQEIVHGMANDLYRAYREKKVTEQQLYLMASTILLPKVPGLSYLPDGLDGLDRELRARIEFIFSGRLRLIAPTRARRYLESAYKDADEGSLLRQLAKAALAEQQAGKGQREDKDAKPK